MKQTLCRKAVPWLLWAISLAAVCATLSPAISATPAASTAAAQSVLPYSATWALAAIALLLGYLKLSAQPRAFGRLSLWVLAALFSSVTTLGLSVAQTGAFSLLSAHPKTALVYFIGRVPMYYMGMALLRHALESPRDAQDDARSLPAWKPALLLLLCWLPYLWLTFPGTVSNDSITQLAELLHAKPMSNGNPVAQTWLLGLFVALGRALGSDNAAITLYVCVQATLMAWLMGLTIPRMREMGAPRWLCRAALAFYALCPVFPCFAFCVGKDTSFAMAVLWLTLSLVRCLHVPKPSRGDRAALIASALLCALLRNAGVYLAAFSLVLALLCLLKRRKRHGGALAIHTTCIALGCVVCVTLGMRLLVLPALGVEPSPETEEWSIPLQQTARVAASCPLTEDERATLAPVLDPDALKIAYNGELSDPVKALWNENATPQEKRAFFSLWLRLVAKHPATCLSATFHNTYGYLYPGYVSTIKPTLLLGAQGRTTLIDGLFAFDVNPRAEAAKQALRTLYQQPLFRLLVSPGLYGWIALFALALVAAKRRGRALVCLTPALFTLAGCLFSAVNGYFRYAMPLYLLAPVALALCCQPRGHQPTEVQE